MDLIDLYIFNTMLPVIYTHIYIYGLNVCIETNIDSIVQYSIHVYLCNIAYIRIRFECVYRYKHRQQSTL